MHQHQYEDHNTINQNCKLWTIEQWINFNYEKNVFITSVDEYCFKFSSTLQNLTKPSIHPTEITVFSDEYRRRGDEITHR